MSTATDLAGLFRRDLTRLVQELNAFPGEETLWQVLPPIANPAGNLALHIEGNLREYVGRQLGKVPYSRQRDLEFSTQALGKENLIQRIEAVIELVPRVVSGLSGAELDAIYPEKVYSAPCATAQLLFSLYGHLSYHLGQIDYLRRILTKAAAIEFVSIEPQQLSRAGR